MHTEGEEEADTDKTENSFTEAETKLIIIIMIDLKFKSNAEKGSWLTRC